MKYCCFSDIVVSFLCMPVMYTCMYLHIHFCIVNYMLYTEIYVHCSGLGTVEYVAGY